MKGHGAAPWQHREPRVESMQAEGTVASGLVVAGLQPPEPYQGTHEARTVVAIAIRDWPAPRIPRQRSRRNALRRACGRRQRAWGRTPAVPGMRAAYTERTSSMNAPHIGCRGRGPGPPTWMRPSATSFSHISATSLRVLRLSAGHCILMSRAVPPLAFPHCSIISRSAIGSFPWIVKNVSGQFSDSGFVSCSMI
jgi:hypothetical protein